MRVRSPMRTRALTGPAAWIGAILPGLALCSFIAFSAFAVARIEARLFRSAPLEPMVLAILIGAGVSAVWTRRACWLPGIDFSAKLLLEIAIVLLGVSVSAGTLMAMGPMLLGGIAGVVVVALGVSLAIGRLMGLSTGVTILVACGNSICGNSAIAAAARVIGADDADVAAAIAFTAVLSVAVILGLPLIGYALHMSPLRYGALTGLTVYAVPQVLAAAAPFGDSAVQMGTLVKLVRVLTLGPVCMMLSMHGPRLWKIADGPAPDMTACERRRPGWSPILHLVPWFILGFLALAALRSLGVVPRALLAAAGTLSAELSVVAMAALGLSVDISSVGRAGGRVIATVVLSLLSLIVIGLALLAWIGPE